MSSKTIIRILYSLNAIYGVHGLATILAGLWFFVIQYQFLDVSNVDHYTDFAVYWAQIVPWAFFILGLIAVTLGFSGLLAVNKRSEIGIKIYCVFLVLLILAQITVSTLIFIYVDSDYSDEFIRKTVYESFNKVMPYQKIWTPFNTVEELYNCCGANSSSDYKNYTNELPSSCCNYVTGTPCTSIVNEKLGCADAVSYYTKMISSVVAGSSLFICLVDLVDVYFAIKLANLFRKASITR
ncbi:leukocyte surface antigen CD53-like [Colias croceus]|uniref:leukocyte surface antigen CD53-like n=1 Tax=Colias crocea TaxID=72248 RepID=UPI001E27C133|nr:leukocyte surface antigen CD53-like [Colias croceus]